MASEAFFGPKNITWKSLLYSVGMATKFASRPHALMEIQPWNQAKKQCTKASQHFATLDIIPSHACQECVVTMLTICLFSGLRSSLLRSDREVRAGTNRICVSNMRVFRLQTKGRQHYLSQNIGSAIAGSARPALPALSERNEWIKETATLKLFKIQSSNFKKLMEKVGRPWPPQPPCF